MSFFRDKEFEEMGWLNEAIEPYVADFHTAYSEMPDVCEAGYKEITNQLRSNISTTSVLQDLIYTHAEKKLLRAEVSRLADHFDMLIEPDTILDISAKTLNKPIIFKKHKDHLSNKEVIDITKRVVSGKISLIHGSMDIKRINEVCSILNISTPSRKKKVKLEMIRERYMDIITKDLWSVRNMDLLIKGADWMSAYLVYESAYGLANLTKLKCMTYSGDPVYSMEEVE